MRLADLCRARDSDNSSPDKEELVNMIRERTVNNICEVPYSVTILSPGFQRLTQFCIDAVENVSISAGECQELGWSKEMYCLESVD